MIAELPQEQANYDQVLAEDIGGFTHDPLGYVLYAFPWGEGDLEGVAGPRAWQVEVLKTIGAHLQNPETRFQPCEITVSSGHGIGKSALMGMVCCWALDTFEDTRIITTANTDTQLGSKTVPEVSRWRRRSITTEWWDVAQRSFKIRDEEHHENWKAEFIPWNLAKPEASAGLHNVGKRIVMLWDEASAIPVKIWETAEGVLTDENTEILWLRFGNPTRADGRFREYFGSRRNPYQYTFKIDARTVEGTNKAQIEKWREAYGEDSDFFRVKVRGEFPRVGLNQMIPSEAIEQCRHAKMEGQESFGKIMAIDVARFGDDQTSFFCRQGRKAWELGTFRGWDTAQTASQAVRYIEDEGIDAVVVDSDGIGATVFDQIKMHGYKDILFEFHGGKAAYDERKYFNRRTEVWGLASEALSAGMEIPDDSELCEDLGAPTYGFSPKQQIQLEKKDDMKARGLHSPDKGDAFCMTFAVNVKPRVKITVDSPFIPVVERSDGAWMA